MILSLLFALSIREGSRFTERIRIPICLSKRRTAVSARFGQGVVDPHWKHALRDKAPMHSGAPASARQLKASSSSGPPCGAQESGSGGSRSLPLPPPGPLRRSGSKAPWDGALVSFSKFAFFSLLSTSHAPCDGALLLNSPSFTNFSLHAAPPPPSESLTRQSSPLRP